MLETEHNPVRLLLTCVASSLSTPTLPLYRSGMSTRKLPASAIRCACSLMMSLTPGAEQHTKKKDAGLQWVDERWGAACGLSYIPLPSSEHQNNVVVPNHRCHRLCGRAIHVSAALDHDQQLLLPLALGDCPLLGINKHWQLGDGAETIPERVHHQHTQSINTPPTPQCICRCQSCPNKPTGAATAAAAHLLTHPTTPARPPQLACPWALPHTQKRLRSQS